MVFVAYLDSQVQDRAMNLLGKRDAIVGNFPDAAKSHREIFSVFTMNFFYEPFNIEQGVLNRNIRAPSLKTVCQNILVVRVCASKFQQY